MGIIQIVQIEIKHHIFESIIQFQIKGRECRISLITHFLFIHILFIRSHTFLITEVPSGRKILTELMIKTYSKLITQVVQRIFGNQVACFMEKKLFDSTFRIAAKAVTICLISTNAFGQQALWNNTDIISPKINADKSVTFRIKAPKAIKIEVEGDFLSPQKIETPFGVMEGTGKSELKETKDGVWEYTSAPLASELYNYSFIVDGQKMNDPNNVYLVRDVSTVTNYFLIPEGRADGYSVQNVPHGNLSKVWYASPTLGMKQRRM